MEAPVLMTLYNYYPSERNTTSILFSSIDDFPQSTLDYLTRRGHTIYRTSSVGVVQGIAVDEEGNVEAYADPRKDSKEGHAVVVQRT